jgi:hypothetical protein
VSRYQLDLARAAGARREIRRRLQDADVRAGAASPTTMAPRAQGEPHHPPRCCFAPGRPSGRRMASWSSMTHRPPTRTAGNAPDAINCRTRSGETAISPATSPTERMDISLRKSKEIRPVMVLGRHSAWPVEHPGHAADCDVRQAVPLVSRGGGTERTGHDSLRCRISESSADRRGGPVHIRWQVRPGSGLVMESRTGWR